MVRGRRNGNGNGESTEVTLGDVVRAIKDLGTTLSDRIDGVSERLDGVSERLDGVAAEVVGLRRDLAVDRRILRRHDAQIAQIQKRVGIGRRR